VLAQVREVDGQEATCRGRLQRFQAYDQGGVGCEVDGILEACDEIGQRHILAIAGEVAVVGERIDHGTRTSTCIMSVEILRSGSGEMEMLWSLGTHDRSESGLAKHCQRLFSRGL